jgi:hypothetical protein
MPRRQLRHDPRLPLFAAKSDTDFRLTDQAAPPAFAAAGRRRRAMRRSDHTLRLALTAAALLLGSAAAPAVAQVSMTDPDAPVACQAFQRWGAGDWTATAPTTLNFDNGMSLRVVPGETFVPGGTRGGVEVTATLDRNCGNL